MRYACGIKMSGVFCLGVAVLDFVFDCDEIPDKATKYRANNASKVVGGGAANAAIAVSKLGGKAVLASRLGDDPVADLISSALASEGVDVSAVHRTNGGLSSYSSIVVDPKGERQIVNFRGDGLTNETDWIELPNDTKSVLADTRWPAGMATALALARKAGIPAIVDVDTPLDDCDFSDATHLAFARPALTELTGQDDIATALKEAATQFGAWVCVTDGANGCHALLSGTTVHIPAPAITAIDTLGAGDVWHGAFALALADGLDEISACRFANVAAGLKCAKKGVAPAMPSRASIEKTMKEMYS